MHETAIENHKIQSFCFGDLCMEGMEEGRKEGRKEVRMDFMSCIFVEGMPLWHNGLHDYLMCKRMQVQILERKKKENIDMGD